MITPTHLLPCGAHALLVELADTRAVLDAAAAIRARVSVADPAFTDVVDVVPAATTVLVTIAGRDLDRLRAGLLRLRPGPGTSDGADAAEVVVAVHYDGPDLEEVASRTGLDVAGVIAAHTGTPWRAAFGGFAPGFAYLVGGDERLSAVPRRGSPRSRVPSGSVALAGGYSAVYPRSSPGGWQLIGRTDLSVWSLDRDPPALLAPGTLVRFADADGAAS